MNNLVSRDVSMLVWSIAAGLKGSYQYMEMEISSLHVCGLQTRRLVLWGRLMNECHRIHSRPVLLISDNMWMDDKLIVKLGWNTSVAWWLQYGRTSDKMARSISMMCLSHRWRPSFVAIVGSYPEKDVRSTVPYMHGSAKYAKSPDHANHAAV